MADTPKADLPVVTNSFVNDDGDRCYYSGVLLPGSIALTDHAAAQARITALQAKLDEWDRILRSAVPDEHKGCASPVGAAQNYISDLETSITALQAELEATQKEAARYRWLRAHVVGKGYAPPFFRSIIGDARATLCEFDRYADAAMSDAGRETP